MKTRTMVVAGVVAVVALCIGVFLLSPLSNSAGRRIADRTLAAVLAGQYESIAGNCVPVFQPRGARICKLMADPGYDGKAVLYGTIDSHYGNGHGRIYCYQYGEEYAFIDIILEGPCAGMVKDVWGTLGFGLTTPDGKPNLVSFGYSTYHLMPDGSTVHRPDLYYYKNPERDRYRALAGAAVVLGIVIGLCQCFGGYQIFRFVLGLMGFLIGGASSTAIAYAVWHKAGLAFAVGLVGGVAGATAMVFLYSLGVFLIGASLGATVGMVLFAVAQASPEPVVLSIAALLAGSIALTFQKFMIITATAYVGALNAVVGIVYFIPGAVDLTNTLSFFESGRFLGTMLCSLALGTLGFVVQYHDLPPEEAEERTSATAREGHEDEPVAPH